MLILNKKKLSRKLTLALCIAFSMTMLAGCTSKTPVKEETKTETKVVEEQSVVYNVGAEPDTIDPTLLTTVGGMTIANQVFEGLMRLDEKNVPVPATAESVDFDAASSYKICISYKKRC